ncbi:MAG TPA: EMC3/TMCO1 family protein [Candidatus Bathyarchaeia archaeon]|nr:EMC3/TMCO1 family protein [Candidatus Bathyarchaeia archaeon]
MKVLKKLVIALILAMVSLSAVSLITGSVSATGGLSVQASISAESSTVRQNTLYTIRITNSGTETIGSANITVPTGYGELGHFTITQQASSQNWTAYLQTGKSNYFIIIFGSTQGLTPTQSLTFTFDARNPLPSGTYKWTVGVSENTTTTTVNVPQSVKVTENSPIVISSITSAILILIIALGIAFLNTALNRVLINYFIGWEQYRVMQKEMNEYRKETMAAARANDKKQVEKLKKRQSQINSMQAKMLKPQMVQLAVSFLYIFIWIFVLTPTYGVTSMVYLPGLGSLSVVYWYPICSFFLGLLGSRILGIMPIEP